MAVSRRKFLAWASGATLAGLGLSQTAYADREFSGYPDTYGVLHDTTRCVGCRSCEAACNKVNNLPPPERSFSDLDVLDASRRTDYKAYTVVNKYRVPIVRDGEEKTVEVYRKTQCNHCLEPACGSACFVNAFEKTPQGAVFYDPTVCVGCRYCVLACPFYIPAYEYHRVNPQMNKCTMCLPRIKEGKLPGCVEACPMEALVFGKREQLLQIARRRIEEHPDRYISHIYGEREMGGSNWLYLAGVPFEKIGLPALGSTPAGDLTHGALSLVPAIVSLWPVLLTGIYVINRQKDRDHDLKRQDAVAEAIAKTKEEEAKKAAAAATRFQQEKEKAIKKALEEQARGK